MKTPAPTVVRGSFVSRSTRSERYIILANIELFAKQISRCYHQLDRPAQTTAMELAATLTRLKNAIKRKDQNESRS